VKGGGLRPDADMTKLGTIEEAENLEHWKRRAVPQGFGGALPIRPEAFARVFPAPMSRFIVQLAVSREREAGAPKSHGMPPSALFCIA
jgi:hypothetical protein